MNKIFSLPALAILSLASSSLAASADFVGTWTNLAPDTRGITRVVIRQGSGNLLSVQVFGKCSPTDCDWGTVPMLTYGANVSDTNPLTASAVFDKGFSKTMLVMAVRGSMSKMLSLQQLTEFTDGSNRQNYAGYEAFRR